MMPLDHITRHAGILTVVLTFSVFLSDGALAQTSSCVDDAFVGTWHLNAAKSKPTAAAKTGYLGGEDVLLGIAPFGAHGWTYEEVDQTNPRIVGNIQMFQTELDGKLVPYRGVDPRLVSAQRVDCNDVEITTRRQIHYDPDGVILDFKPEGTVDVQSHLRISADRKTLTDTARGLVFDRLGGLVETKDMKCPTNPIIGTWYLEHSKSTITRQKGRIGDRTLIYTPYGDNGYTYIKFNQVPRQPGTEEHYSAQFDNKPAPSKGNDPRLIAVNRVDCNKYEITNWRQTVYNMEDGGTVKSFDMTGRVGSKAIYEISPDGKTMVDVHSGELGDQTKYENEQLHYVRK